MRGFFIIIRKIWLQAKADQDVLDLDSLKHSSNDGAASLEKQHERLAALEMQLAAASDTNNGRNVPEEVPPYGNIEKDQMETDTPMQSTNFDDTNSESTSSNANSNGDRTQGAQPKVIKISLEISIFRLYDALRHKNRFSIYKFRRIISWFSFFFFCSKFACNTIWHFCKSVFFYILIWKISYTTELHD